MVKLKSTQDILASRDLGVPIPDGKREESKDQSSPPLMFVERMKVFLTYCTAEYNKIIAESVGTRGYMKPFDFPDRKLLIECILLIQQQEFVMLRFLETLEDAA